MSKEEKIKEAYGDYWDSFNLTSKKCALNNNGWISQILDHAPDNELYLEFQNQTFRPKSLQGIENNNGWIIIESEDDFPQQGGEYMVFRMSKTTTATYCKNNRWFVPENDYPKTTFQHGISHYRKKEVIPDPIY